MKLRIPKVILLLLAIYAFSFVTDLYRTVFYTTRPDYLLYDALGIGYLFFVFRLPFVIIEGLLLWFLWKAKPGAIGLFIAQLLLATLNATLYYFVAVNNLDIARATYIVHRQSQGLNTNVASIEAIFSPGGLLMTFGATIGYFLLLAALFFWKRGYFVDKDS